MKDKLTCPLLVSGILWREAPICFSSPSAFGGFPLILVTDGPAIEIRSVADGRGMSLSYSYAAYESEACCCRCTQASIITDTHKVERCRDIYDQHSVQSRVDPILGIIAWHFSRQNA